MKRYSTEQIRELIITGNKKKFYDQHFWRNTLRPRILFRDGYECVHCKREGKVKVAKENKIDINHIKSLEEYPELAYEESNLEAICVHHHNIADNKKFEVKRKEQLNEERW